MHADIKRLATLSDTDTRFQRAGWEIDAAHAAITDGETDLAAAEAKREAICTELEEVRTTERALNRKVEQYNKRMKRAIKVLETGAADAAAAERQRVQCEQIIDESETEVLEVMEEVEAILARLATQEGAVAMVQQKLAEAREAAPGTIERLKAERGELDTLRKTLRADLTPDMRSRYDLLLAKKPPPVARIYKTACLKCRIVIQPQMLIELRRGRPQACRGCGRWLAPADTDDDE